MIRKRLFLALFTAAIAIVSMVSLAKQEKVLQIFQNGSVVQEYPISEIDYIEINDIVAAPSDVAANVSGNQITISWNEVAGAVYNIYRSSDNVKFTLLQSNIADTSYTDTNPLPGTNYYKVKAIVNGVEGSYSTIAAGTVTDSGLENGVYLGITGFNQELYKYPIGHIDENSIDGFRGFVDNLNMKNGTLLYYSVNEAINSLQSTSLPDNVSSAAIVTFTDGLDKGSWMMDKTYPDNAAYLNAINNRIKNKTVSGQNITAYSIGVRGQDVTDVAMFQNNLKKLASSDANAYEVANMAEVNAKFKEIAKELSKSNYIQTINLIVPGEPNGTTIRFTFDNVTDASKSKLYIEGVFNLTNMTLEKVKYVGMTSTSGTTIKGSQNGIFVNFSFEGIHTNTNKLIDNKFTDEWTYVASNGTWQINSEFDNNEDSKVITEKSSAAIMLILDCSSSLGSQFKTAQNNAKDFINTLYEAVGGNTNNPENPNPQDSKSIFSNSLTTEDEFDFFTVEAKVESDFGAWHMNTNPACAIANSYSAPAKENLVAESWLISPVIDLSNYKNCSLDFEQSFGFDFPQNAADAAQWFVVKIKEEGSDTWTDIVPATYPEKPQGNWSSFVEDSLNIKNFDGKKIRFAFAYKNDGAKSRAWEIKNVKVKGETTGAEYITYSTTPADMTLAVWKDGTRYYLTQEEYRNANLSDFTIEGLTVIGGKESFILELYDAQTNSISDPDVALWLYGEILPSTEQARIISAKWDDINSALTSFNGIGLSLSSCYYTSETTLKDCYTNVYCGSGGNIYETNMIPLVRGVRPINNNGSILWNHPDDLKLAVIIKGEKDYLDYNEYNERKNEIDEIIGVTVIAGGEEFAVQLHDAQTGSISNVETAKNMYGNVMPTTFQGHIISSKWYDINKAMSKFGGDLLRGPYYTSATNYYSSATGYDFIIGGSGGNLCATNQPIYIRGVVNLHSEQDYILESGNGTIESPYTCADVRNLNPTSTSEVSDDCSDVYVEGYIVGYVYNSTDITYSTFGVGSLSNTNIVLGPTPLCTDPKKCICVQLPDNEFRKAINLKDNPWNYKKRILLHGDVLKYMNAPGIRNIKQFEFR